MRCSGSRLYIATVVALLTVPLVRANAAAEVPNGPPPASSDTVIDAIDSGRADPDIDPAVASGWSVESCLEFAATFVELSTEPLDADPADICRQHFNPPASNAHSDGVATAADLTAQAQLYAGDFGVDEAGARQRLNLQEQAGEIAGLIRIVAGDRLSYAGISHTDSFGVVATLTAGPEIPQLAAIAQSSPVPVQVTYDGIHSVAALVDQGKVLAASLLKQGFGAPMMSVDEKRQRLVLTVRQSGDNGALDRLSAAVDGARVSVPVAIITLPEDAELGPARVRSAQESRPDSW